MRIRGVPRSIGEQRQTTIIGLWRSRRWQFRLFRWLFFPHFRDKGQHYYRPIWR